MMPFLEWLEDPKYGFWIRQSYDYDKEEWVGMGKLVLTERQKKILGKALNLNDEGKFDYETILYSCPKKSGKTAINAAVMAWMAEVEQDGTEIFILANDLDSAQGRVMRDVQFHFQARIEEHDKDYCKINQYRIDFPNGTFIQVVAQSFKSVAGSRHAVTGWDELWGFMSERSRRTWDEMTPIPTVPRSLRFISTYAGFENESDLLWEMYLQGVGPEEHEDGRGTRIEGLEDVPCWENGRMFTYWDHYPSMPWQTEEYYEQQLETNRPAAYLRLHENRWVTSHEEFIPIEWWDRAAQAYDGPATTWSEHPMRTFPITIGIDAGIKRDSTALVGVAYDAKRGKIGVVFHKIWVPSKDNPIDLERTVESELLSMYNKYNIVHIACDPTQLHQTITKFKRLGYPIHEYPQSVGKMVEASQTLFDTLRNGAFETYQDEVLRKHIQMASAETTSRGFRIVKPRVSRKHHVDGAIALAMAVRMSVKSGGVDVTIPVVVGNPYEKETSRDEVELPFPLRT